MESLVSLHFPVLHQYWMDSGLLGFYTLANENVESYPDVKLCADEIGVHLRGSKSDLESFLKQVYEVLLQKYYNTSTQKQRDEKAGFYYDTKSDTFVRFPKVKAHGIAEVIFNKAPRPTRGSVPYKGGKNQLPEPYTYLQERFDAFLSKNNLKAVGKKLLIDGRNEIHPKVDISLVSKKPIATCRLCGRKTHCAREISGTVFPLITSSTGIKSFVSGCENVDVVCWMCDYVAKFVPVLGHYSTNGESTYIFLMHSQSFQKMINVVPSLRSLTKYDENFFRNYEETLGSYFQHPFEQFFSFLYTVYLRTLAFSKKDSGSEEDRFLESLYGIFIDRSPMSIYILHVQKLGQSFIGKLVWNFTESVYLFRLFQDIYEKGIDLKRVMSVLVDYDQPKNESKTLVRNRICERLLKKQRIIDLVESFVYHVCRSETKYIKPAYDFMIAYEQILAGDDTMTMKRELIYTAVSLGKTLGLTLGTEGRKARGDLFRLRKTRRPADFLNEVNRLQMKYSVSVTADLYNSGEEFDKNFSEFKQFCMVAALNSFNAKISEKKHPENNYD